MRNAGAGSHPLDVAVAEAAAAPRLSAWSMKPSDGHRYRLEAAVGVLRKPGTPPRRGCAPARRVAEISSDAVAA